jgi:hypothetical protein
MSHDPTAQSFIADKYPTYLYHLQDLRCKLAFNGFIGLPQEDFSLSLDSIEHLIRHSTTPETRMSLTTFPK